MAKKKQLQPVLWYSLAPPKLSEDVPNIQPGDLLQLSRKKRLRKTKDIVLQKNGRWRSYMTTFPAGTLMTYLGEFFIQTEGGKKYPSSLVPKIKLLVWGAEEDGHYFLTGCELNGLKKFSQ